MILAEAAAAEEEEDSLAAEGLTWEEAVAAEAVEEAEGGEGEETGTILIIFLSQSRISRG